MTLNQAVERRLTDIYAAFAESGISELTGKSRGYYEGTRERVVGRFRGVRHGFPETVTMKQSPKAIAAAIKRGKGKVYRIVRERVEREMIREGYTQPKHYEGRRTVEPHAGRSYCRHCRESHTRGQHCFHGSGSYHETHLFSFGKNPMRYSAFRYVITKIYQGRSSYWSNTGWHEDVKYAERFASAAEAQRWIDAHRMDHYQQAFPERIGRTTKKQFNPKRKNPPAVKIYGKVLRIEAQKTGKHLCDSACKKAGHRYYHDFRVKPTMYGLPDGSLLIKK